MAKYFKKKKSKGKIVYIRIGDYYKGNYKKEKSMVHDNSEGETLS